ncbi:hypothetical protein TMatcc_003906 [Talaromyces marneffei ATCC 18224]
MPPRVLGFIGLGVMGYPMALNVLKKLEDGTKLQVYDDIIFTIVPEGRNVRAVYLGEANGALTANIDNKIFIDCSTIDTATSIAVHDMVRAKSSTASFYDAPVSGGSLGAVAGTLTFMLGCAEDDPNFPLLNDLLGAMGKSIFACGGFSLGLTAKLCNNYCSGLIAVATAEAMNIGIRSGMDPTLLSKIFSTSTAQSTINDKWNPVPGVCPSAPTNKDYQGGFKVQLMRKDFQLAVDTAKRVDARLFLAAAGLDIYQKASEDDKCRDRDSRVVFRYIGGNENWKEQLKSRKT